MILYVLFAWHLYCVLWFRVEYELLIQGALLVFILTFLVLVLVFVLVLALFVLRRAEKI